MFRLQFFSPTFDVKIFFTILLDMHQLSSRCFTVPCRHIGKNVAVQVPKLRQVFCFHPRTDVKLVRGKPRLSIASVIEDKVLRHILGRHTESSLIRLIQQGI